MGCLLKPWDYLPWVYFFVSFFVWDREKSLRTRGTPDNVTRIRSDRLTAYALSSSLCRMIPRVLCDLGSGFNTGSRLTWAWIRVWHVIRRAEIAVAIIITSITVRASTTAILLTEHLVYISEEYQRHRRSAEYLYLVYHHESAYTSNILLLCK